MSTQVNKLSTEREGGVKKSSKIVYVECERPLKNRKIKILSGNVFLYRNFWKMIEQSTIVETLVEFPSVKLNYM